MDPDEARRKFDESFFWAVGIVFFIYLSIILKNTQNLDPGDPNTEARPTVSEKTKEDIWDADLQQKEEKKVEIKMQESKLDTIIDCRTFFDPFHPEKITGYNIFAQCFDINFLTGHIYGEKLHLQNYGDVIELAIPTSINERTLVWVRAGDREWTTKSEPNQVFNLYSISKDNCNNYKKMKIFSENTD